MKFARNSFLFLLFFFVAHSLFSQGRYTIRYETGSNLNDSISPREINYYSMLVINDSASYFFSVTDINEKLPKTPYGSKFRGHSVYVDTKKGISLSQSEPRNYSKLLIQDSLMNDLWILEDEEKIISGYRCKKASRVMNERAVIAYYSTDLPANFGPYEFGGLRGTILELQFAGNASITKAVSIKKEAVDIIEPRKGKRVSKEKFNRILKNLRSS